MGRSRRLSKDNEEPVGTRENMTQIRLIHLFYASSIGTLMRAAIPGDDKWTKPREKYTRFFVNFLELV